jgi:hypothetical protein
MLHLGTAALRRRRYFLAGPRTTKAVFCATSPPGVIFAPVAVSTITAGNSTGCVGMQALLHMQRLEGCQQRGLQQC